MSDLRVACLGWGSLLWDPRTLPMAEGFRAEGPMLPIEFSRVAMDGRVTLVIDPGAPPIRTYCVRLDVTSLEAATRALGIREKIAPNRLNDWIGVQTRETSARNSGEMFAEFREGITEWLTAQPLDAVVWTALPPRAPDGNFEHPSLDVLLRHLASLEGSALARAEEYIRRAPEAVRTPRRERFEEVFGWSPIAEARRSSE
jgi:hypothetical protein